MYIKRHEFILVILKVTKNTYLCQRRKSCLEKELDSWLFNKCFLTKRIQKKESIIIFYFIQ